MSRAKSRWSAKSVQIDRVFEEKNLEIIATASGCVKEYLTTRDEDSELDPRCELKPLQRHVETVLY